MIEPIVRNGVFEKALAFFGFIAVSFVVILLSDLDDPAAPVTANTGQQTIVLSLSRARESFSPSEQDLPQDSDLPALSDPAPEEETVVEDEQPEAREDLPEDSVVAPLPRVRPALPVRHQRTEREMVKKTRKKRLLESPLKTPIRKVAAKKTQAQPIVSHSSSKSRSDVASVAVIPKNKNSEATGSYWATVQQHLARNKTYPQKARRRKMEGRAVIEITLLLSGRVESYRIIESTGHRLLDKAVVKMIEKSSPFPSFPADLQQERMTRRIPVIYRLKN